MDRIRLLTKVLVGNDAAAAAAVAMTRVPIIFEECEEDG